MICKTKNDLNVGYFGFTPNCSSFYISGYYQEYGKVFIKIQTYVHDRWNSLFCEKDSSFPEEMQKLEEN